MRNIVTVVSFLFLFNVIQAQDLHFSQLHLNARMLHVASMGQANFDTQLSASYRSQWSAIPSAYRNITLGFEQNLKNISWGTSLLHNDAGRNSLKTTKVNFNFSFRKRLSSNGDFLSLGASGGMIQQRFQPEFFQFDNQFVEGIGFDKNQNHRETFSRTSQILPSFSAGIFVVKKIKKIQGSLGLSFAHINQPLHQFYDNQRETYPIRISVFAKTQFPLREGLKGGLKAAWNQQSVAKEKLVGAEVLYQLNAENWLNIGLGTRLNDALIFELGMTFKDSRFTLSFDWNHSKLSSATNGRGAIELSVIYGFHKKSKAKNTVVKSTFTPEKNNTIAIDTDTDGDGVKDNLDACPNLFGDKNTNGCPPETKDSDRDGLIDEVDKCPFVKGTVEMQGCPDSDKDGLSDLDDYCPFLKGDKNNKGCPTINIETHQAFLKDKTISTLVEFDTDQSLIKSYFHSGLNEVAEFMLANPEAQAYLTGHTDNEGNSAYNFQLGERRAHAVMEYLIRRGVPYGNISVISFGETKPLRSNRSDYEKAKNRRVEVNVFLSH